jgi:hypothetical protein
MEDRRRVYRVSALRDRYRSVGAVMHRNQLRRRPLQTLNHEVNRGASIGASGLPAIRAQIFAPCGQYASLNFLSCSFTSPLLERLPRARLRRRNRPIERRSGQKVYRTPSQAAAIARPGSDKRLESSKWALIALAVGLVIHDQLGASWPSPDSIRGLTRPSTRPRRLLLQLIDSTDLKPRRRPTAKPSGVDGRVKRGHDGEGGPPTPNAIRANKCLLISQSV